MLAKEISSTAFYKHHEIELFISLTSFRIGLEKPCKHTVFCVFAFTRRGCFKTTSYQGKLMRFQENCSTHCFFKSLLGDITNHACACLFLKVSPAWNEGVKCWNPLEFYLPVTWPEHEYQQWPLTVKMPKRGFEHTLCSSWRAKSAFPTVSRVVWKHVHPGHLFTERMLAKSCKHFGWKCSTMFWNLGEKWYIIGVEKTLESAVCCIMVLAKARKSRAFRFPTNLFPHKAVQ